MAIAARTPVNGSIWMYGGMFIRKVNNGAHACTNCAFLFHREQGVLTSTSKYRLLAATNFEFVAIGVFEEEGVVPRTVVFANFRPLQIFSASIAYEFRNPIQFFARVRPKRDPCVIRFMFFIPSKAKELRGFAAARRIESMVSPRLFVNESKLRQKFPVKIFGRFDICHPQIDMIEATRFHSRILNRIATQFNQGRARSPLRAEGIKVSARARSDAPYRALPQSATKRAKIGPSFLIVDFGHNFRSVTSAVSNAECSGQFGSLGIRGMTSAMTLRAVSEFASK